MLQGIDRLKMERFWLMNRIKARGAVGPSHLRVQRKPNAWGVTVAACLASFLPLLFHACATSQLRPEQHGNICEIFRENTYWYSSARDAYERWGISIPVMMAIVHQESRFVADAKPPRTTCLWIFPGPRPSSAYGYAQASDDTWEEYIESTGNTWAERDSFEDAIDFIGWYCDLSAKRCMISKKDVYHLYLAYHEGHGGFIGKTYKNKAWLAHVASKVQKMADRYKGQLASCEGEFVKKGWCLWPF
jgi:hypothetical protein